MFRRNCAPTAITMIGFATFGSLSSHIVAVTGSPGTHDPCGRDGHHRAGATTGAVRKRLPRFPILSGLVVVFAFLEDIAPWFVQCGTAGLRWGLRGHPASRGRRPGRVRAPGQCLRGIRRRTRYCYRCRRRAHWLALCRLDRCAGSHGGRDSISRRGRDVESSAPAGHRFRHHTRGRVGRCTRHRPRRPDIIRGTESV